MIFFLFFFLPSFLLCYFFLIVCFCVLFMIGLHDGYEEKFASSSDLFYCCVFFFLLFIFLILHICNCSSLLGRGWGRYGVLITMGRWLVYLRINICALERVCGRSSIDDDEIKDVLGGVFCSRPRV